MGILIYFKFFRLFENLSFSKGFFSQKEKKNSENLPDIEWNGRENEINLFDVSSDSSRGESIKRETLLL